MTETARECDDEIKDEDVERMQLLLGLDPARAGREFSSPPTADVRRNFARGHAPYTPYKIAPEAWSVLVDALR